jgi:transposase
MDGDRITMSQRERDRLKVMSLVLEGQRTQVEAARLAGVAARTVRRWQRRLEAQGDGGIVHRLRGRPSNAGKGPGYRRQVLEAYKKDYPDFGPTLAAEKLSERGLPVAVETLRCWLIEAELWRARRRRHKHRRRRARRECFGELVQADGSVHDWLEGRGETMTLLVMIDDATSKVVARFYEAETTEGYMDLLGRYLRKHGRMVAFYADRHSSFFATDRHGEAVLTQFGRALGELDIELIPAGSPQAKGRVERFNGTAQDRLVKELRLAGASTMAQANVVLDEVFLPWFNRRCTVKPASGNDAHRRLHPSLNLAATLSIQSQRKVANDYTLRFANQLYQLLPPAQPGLRGGQVTVEERLDGTRHLRFKGRYLKYELVGSAEPSGALPPCPRGLSHGRTPAEGQKGRAVSAAQPSAVRSAVRRSGCTPAEPCPADGSPEPTSKKPWRPPADHPWRKFRLAARSKSGHFYRAQLPDISIGG